MNCYYCKIEIKKDLPPTDPCKATTDHKIPKVYGGAHLPGNKVDCCYRCNQAKGMLTERQFRRLVLPGILANL